MYQEYVKQLTEAKRAYNAGDETAAAAARGVREAAYHSGICLFRLEAAAHEAANPGQELNWNYALPPIVDIYYANMPTQTVAKLVSVGALVHTLGGSKG